MGYEADYDIVSAMGSEERYVAQIAPSIEECARSQVVTQKQALEYIGSKVGSFSGISCNLLVKKESL